MINKYYVSREARDWVVIRRANSSNGNVVCRHDTRQSARECCWGRNGNRCYADKVCDDNDCKHGSAQPLALRKGDPLNLQATFTEEELDRLIERGRTTNPDEDSEKT